MDNAMTVTHDFQEIKECGDEQKAFDKNQIAVICVGSTGTGKSSLIKLFCGNNVIVGHNVNSATKGSHLFKEANAKRYWLDSQGANDSDGADDEKVLTDVLKKLYDNKITNIKVIWCVSGDFDRAKQEFQTQAGFIKSLGNGVWNSCLIVQKKGPIDPDDIDGVLEAAKHKGANINYGDKRLFGYTGLDYMSDAAKQNDRLLRKILKKPDTKEREQELVEDGYLTNKQIIDHVEERLGRLSSLKITFEVKKCVKCGEKGDPRFVYAPCHSEKEKYHPQSTVQYHTGYVRTFHPSGTYSDHSGSLNTHYRTEYYHSSSRTYYNFFKHGDTDWRHSCCEKYKGSSGCCSRSVYSSSSYSCCGWSSGSSGCRTRYACCYGSPGSTGCKKEWTCCQAPESNAGCRRRYQCCGKDLGAEGCKDRCQSCQKAWGSSKGCIQTAKKL